MRILVIGSGGREHALVWALKKTSQRPLELFCAPGNAGIAEIAECVPIAATDVNALADFGERARVDLTIVGPEAALAAGVVDEFEQRGLRIVGPTRQAAQLETSKAFAKEFMQRHGISTAHFRVTRSIAEALDVLSSGQFGDERAPVVIKADGLAAGKGVVVAQSRAEAEQAIRELSNLGSAAERIVIEEALFGREASVLLFTDGEYFRFMPPAQDHKRLSDGDTGPNTGGMGAVTGNHVIDSGTLQRVMYEIVEPTLEGARVEGFPFRGILFVGLMLTPDGPKVLEYNVRFGDPETQAILVRLQTDLAWLFEMIVDQRLRQVNLQWSDDASACVVLASHGYPAKPQIGALIEGLDHAAQHDQIAIFHSATSRGRNGEWLTAGGRVLAVTATGATLEAALARCYGVVAEIRWDGMHYRSDIGRTSTPSAAASG